jgi:hypothetical protein
MPGHPPLVFWLASSIQEIGDYELGPAAGLIAFSLKNGEKRTFWAVLPTQGYL